ncbi:hypothetical protein GGU11DRAFT_280195 [Lentinula aff. detonsa]|nr:hypothetical protein GGU11DRAFT_280195 [Lentinula aff. detonsa]
MLSFLSAVTLLISESATQISTDSQHILDESLDETLEDDRMCFWPSIDRWARSLHCCDHCIIVTKRLRLDLYDIENSFCRTNLDPHLRPLTLYSLSL